MPRTFEEILWFRTISYAKRWPKFLAETNRSKNYNFTQTRVRNMHALGKQHLDTTKIREGKAVGNGVRESMTENSQN